MDDVTALRKLVRTVRYNPDNFEKRLSELNTVWQRMFVEGRDDLEPFLDMLNEESARFLAHQDHKGQRADGPTLQTVRRLRDDPVVMLKTRGTITADDEKTIQELRELHAKVTMGLAPGGGGQSGERVDTSTKSFVHPIERLTARQDRIYVHVYKPWAEIMNRSGIRLGEKGRVLALSPFNLVISLICDSMPLAKMENTQKVRHGVLSPIFVGAIRDFARRLSIAENEGLVPRGRT